MNDRGESPDPADRLLVLLGGKWVAAAISAAASLGIADALGPGPLRLEELAARTRCQPQALERLMRVLVGEDLVREESGVGYALTEMGALLARGRLGELATFVGSPFSWDPWSALADSVRSGESAFAKRHGLPLFDYLDHHGDQADLYHAAIDAFSKREARALAEAFDFSPVSRVADIGGGRGTLLIEVLSRWPHLEGVLVERPAAAEQARAALARAGLDQRCDTRVGDFFESVPGDVEVCILMHIIHSWDDPTSIDLLDRCRQAVGPDGTVLVVEGLVVPDGRRDLTNLLDLEMLVLCGPGHERRKPEMRRLFSAAGLKLERAVPLTAGVR
ncbi:MAG TPA: hydroxyneurosporene methyltransferase, partial [Deltaproteobacteria bacterium]|nr:hydroxyneurosporene methyltransferase [Deltaproteobacteria bacterium]